jgi:type II secretory pathway pseudopilin PulG
MRRFRDDAISRRAGFTLMELVLAAALMAILMIAVFALIDGSMSMWRRTETRRNLTDQAIGVVELFAQDVRALEGGERGDLLLEWVRFDTDGDELKETVWPRLRLVRQASPEELARIFAELDAPADAAAMAEARLVDDQAQEEPEAARIDVPGLIEVAWVIVPMDRKQPEARAEGLLYRGARRLADRASASYFEPGFIRASGMPHVEELDEVTGGLLWFQPLMATQTSIVHDGWSIGGEQRDASTSWDAWEQDRADTTIHAWNQPNRGMARAEDRAVLPRRVRLEVEFERPVDRKRRAHTLTRIEQADVGIDVDDGQRLPGRGHHVKIDGEWMLVTRVSGDRLTVKRAQRGTEAMIHDPGAMVHWGLNLSREVPVALYREDWDL